METGAFISRNVKFIEDVYPVKDRKNFDVREFSDDDLEGDRIIHFFPSTSENLEEEFDIDFSEELAENIKTVEEAVELIKNAVNISFVLSIFYVYISEAWESSRT